ncbi:hypothetical protein QNA08_04650 [Chelatococcus sp. SYSU_G07232]|uniref:Uncharacterized protein n=1 Tax=Chelatococcus albus TaxID=3047466 RepID=A0ABT7ADS0_9HYPH|nr:hypothetical protein [Chelatococcus sp. SYSU_G07232]MDJ1157528.1 hypothetical protein [Chelatococcus sp. SYSU_G07232]
MDMICERDVIAAVGEADELIIREAVRTKASRRELRLALAFTRGAAHAGAEAYGRLPGRMKRLVDLLTVASAGFAPPGNAAGRTNPPEAGHHAA